DTWSPSTQAWTWRWCSRMATTAVAGPAWGPALRLHGTHAINSRCRIRAMDASVATVPRSGVLDRLSSTLYLHPRLLLFLLLTPPLLWLGVIYLGSLFSLLLQSFFYIDEFSGLVVREFSLATWRALFTLSN